MRRLVLAAAISVAAAVSPAAAADLPSPALLPPAPASPIADAAPFFVKLGVGGLFLSAKADVAVAGAPVAGANVKVRPQYTMIVEAGYNITPNWAVSVTTGLPPVAKVDAAGVISPYGRLATVRYGPMAMTAHYHFDFGAFRPYLGAGPVLLLVVRNRDRALADFEMRNNVGFAVQAGADYMITERFGLFLDAKKAYLRTTAVATLGGAPVRAKVRLDPLILSTGVVARF